MLAILKSTIDFGIRILRLRRDRGPMGAVSAAAATVLAVAFALPASAQDAAIVQAGNAVVTGFSGFVSVPAPDEEDPFDYLTINLDGPSAQVVNLSYLGSQGQLSDALKTFAVPSAQVGQVFGVALDNAPNPNIYVAATSAYGLSIYLPDGTDTIRRVRTGTPGAQFVPGQFGAPEMGGGPGSIWRIDGTTGEILLFANIDATGPASLGGLAFDPATQQIFVADRSTGIIHRFGLDGTEQGTYDHGVEGRPPAGLPALPYVPTPPVDINSPSFDTQSPATWGFAQPARRVFAIAVKDDRLFYSVAQGQVWSVGISPSGAVAANPQLEVEVPALQDGIEITSITFDAAGRMYLAERGRTTGDYELTNLANGGSSRVLRFIPKPAGDPTPGNWRLQPDQYAIGLAPAYNNADGGVALGYGYQPNGVINYDACRATLWSTGERLLDPGNPAQPPGSYPAVDGLQGNAPPLIEPQNEPPTGAWYVQYSDAPGSPDYRGYMGAVAVYSPCAIEAPYVPPQTVTCPPGTIFENGTCVVTVTCPPGTAYSDGKCIYETCPPGYVVQGGQCVPPPIACPPGMAFYNGKCVPLECPPGMNRLPNGQCVCPADSVYYNGKCVPQNVCPPGMVKYPSGVCWCPLGTSFQNGHCVPNWCPKGYISINGKCVPERCPPGFHKGPNGFCVPDIIPCGPGEILVKGQCVPKACPPFEQFGPDGKCHPIFKPCKPGEVTVNGKCVPIKCPPLQQLGPNGKCQPIIITCPSGKTWQNGKCVSICKKDEQWINGKCVPLPPKCKPNEQLINGKCFPLPPKCKPNEQLINGKCFPLPPKCKPNEQLINGQCFPLPPKCKPNEQLINGQCFPLPPKCKQNEQLINGQCVPLPPKCKANEQLINGKCVPLPPKCKQNEQLINGQCVPLPPKCKQNEQLVNGKCVPLPPKCKQNEQLINGQCVPLPPKCKQNEQLVNGKCVPLPPKPPKCSGVQIGGACWYQSGPGQSCKSVCSARGGYDSATKSYAGSGGSNAKCQSVLDGLGLGKGKVNTMTGKGYGCFLNSLSSTRIRDKKNTDDGASSTGAVRACACNN